MEDYYHWCQASQVKDQFSSEGTNHGTVQSETTTASRPSYRSTMALNANNDDTPSPLGLFGPVGVPTIPCMEAPTTCRAQFSQLVTRCMGSKARRWVRAPGFAVGGAAGVVLFSLQLARCRDSLRLAWRWGLPYFSTAIFTGRQRNTGEHCL